MFNIRKLSRARIKALIASRILREAQAQPTRKAQDGVLIPVAFEPLEGRCLMSGGPFGFESGGFEGGGFDGGGGFGGDHHNAVGQTITFSQAPSAVQTGLDTLATTDGVTAPTSTTTVYLNNSNGIESYTVDITGTGTQTRLTVDQKGNPVTAPTESSTTFGAITNTSVTAEITAIASALSLTAPTSTTLVNVSTASGGTATYTIALANSSTSTTTSWDGNTIISVDSSGDPVRNERLPLSTLSSAIQSGLTGNAPSGATALTSTSFIDVRTVDGVTTYTADYTSSGTTSTVTVNSAGKLTSLPGTTTADFSTIPTAAQTELQMLATADGASTAISSTQTVTEYAETNGTTVYSVNLDATSSTSSSTYTITLSVDANGNPTVPPHDFGGRFDGFGGGGCDGDTTTSTGTTATNSGTASTSSSSATSTASTTTASVTSAAVVAAQVEHASTTTSSSTSASGSDTSSGTTSTKTAKGHVHRAARHKHHKA